MSSSGVQENSFFSNGVLSNEPIPEVLPLTVLKFGSSVVRSELELRDAVQEIYRWMRQGHRVIAVISAIGSATNQLIAQAESYGERVNERALAALVSTGEAQAAALLGLALDRSGIPAVIMDETRLGLHAQGPILDSEPLEVSVRVLQDALTHVPVVVIPGFVGRQPDGSICLVGNAYRQGDTVRAVIAPDVVEVGSPLAATRNEEKCLLIHHRNGVDQVRGKGAGRWPTAEAVIADIFEVSSALRLGEQEAFISAL